MCRGSWLVLITALGCSETGLTGIEEQQDPPRDEVDDAGRPDLVVSPASLRFAPLERGEEATATLQLLNDGDALLTLDDLFLLEDAGDFRIDLPEDWTLDPGQVETVDVRLRPTSADDPSDTLRIRSDDPSQARVDVPLDGTVLLPELLVEPSSFDFGSLRVETEASVEVVVTNIGDADATLQTTSYVSSSADLDLVEGLGAAVVLPPSGSHAFDVRFAPTEPGAVEGTLYVSTDVPGQTQVASFHEGRAVGDRRPALIGIDADGELREFDAATGATTRLATMDPLDAYGLTYDPSRGTIWVLAGFDGGVQLRSLDPCTGKTTLEHRLAFPTVQGNRPEGFTVTDDGSRIWVAWGEGAFDSDELGWIDPTTGTITRVGDISGTVQGEVDHIEVVGSTLYGRDGDSRNNSVLYELDTSTGRASTVGTMGMVHPGGMATDPDSGLSYVTDTDGSLHLVDYSTGRTTRIGGGRGRPYRDFDFVELSCP